jgi:2-polyprenyl-3-methyl-5-hydroxy-6-metoxy-1,4-benzoquinol methylase
MANLIDLHEKAPGYYSQGRFEMLEFIPSSAKKILDVGCGEGWFGEQLKKVGKEIWGIEIDRKSAFAGEGRLFRVIVGDAVSAISDLPDKYFDCVVCNDVLEHLVDPYNFLLKMKLKLSPEGLIVASIPNVRYFYNLKKLLIEKQWKYENFGILDKTHVRFFTEKSIRETFNFLGFEILRIQGINAFKPSWKFKILNLFLFGNLSDTLYLQFACVIKNISSE